MGGGIGEGETEVHLSRTRTAFFLVGKKRSHLPGASLQRIGLQKGSR